MRNKKFYSEESIRKSVEGMIDEQEVSENWGGRFSDGLSEKLDKSKYVLKNLGVHFSIGVIFASDFLPLPLGTISRVAWVLVNRTYYEIKKSLSLTAP
ncbi:MAG: hypothetical protein KJ718_00375 [Nanoarchaeota archaeon]|nr:hypothetical protein [Nanoarchaeota archaeon]MBU1050996.1 hypothetical protein [Nanoarchaeota archaeon]MBU1988337.1 hypothetical protein [Nanoarchaeota archaeon]